MVSVRINLWLVMAAIFLLSNCQSTSTMQKEAQTTNSFNYQAIAREKLVGHIEYQISPGKKRVLCQTTQKPTPQDPSIRFHYLVIDLETKAILYEEELTDCTISWLNDNQLKIQEISAEIVARPGLPSMGVYVYDLVLKRRLAYEQQGW